mmetsp:Transcript_43503/g.120896  ORF Transcript_43503/g.120896 Transcript_43503/m.120896 type:complete len:202 (+) Transcript_43503:773-1378(+)
MVVMVDQRQPRVWRGCPLQSGSRTSIALRSPAPIGCTSTESSSMLPGTAFECSWTFTECPAPRMGRSTAGRASKSGMGMSAPRSSSQRQTKPWLFKLYARWHGTRVGRERPCSASRSSASRTSPPPTAVTASWRTTTESPSKRRASFWTLPCQSCFLSGPSTWRSGAATPSPGRSLGAFCGTPICIIFLTTGMIGQQRMVD